MNLIVKDNKVSFSSAINDKKKLANYIYTVPETLILAPLEKKTVQLVITTPMTMTGGNQAVLFFESTPDIPVLNKKELTYKLSPKLGALIFQETEGTINVRSKISGVEIIKQTKSVPFGVKITVVNQGNSLIHGSALISLMDNAYKYLGKTKISLKAISAGETTALNTNWNTMLPSGDYHALITYQYRGKNIVIDKVFKID